MCGFLLTTTPVGRMNPRTSGTRVLKKEESMRRRTTHEVARAGPGLYKMPNVSRRRFVGITAGAAGGVLGAGLWTPARSEHRDDDDDHDRQAGRPCPEQDPIPHLNAGPPAAIGGFRFFFPGPVDGSPAATDPEPQPAHAAGRDPSLIFNFDGVIGQADLTLTGTGTDTTTGVSAKYGFHTDMRFMKGKFLGTDNKIHHGAFAFI